MLTSYRVHPDAAVAWQPMCEPKRARQLDVLAKPQITTVVYTGGGALTTDTSFTVTDDETGQVYGPVTGTGSATYATMLDNAVAALQASEIGIKLFTFAEDGATTITATARHSNRSYTWAVSGGPSATPPVASNTQDAAGPDRLPFGFVAKGSAEREAVALGASTTLADIVGVLHRNEARALRQLPDVADAVEMATISVRRQYDKIAIPYEGSAPSGGDVHLRIAQTSGSGTVGTLLAAPAGTGATYTVTPTAIDLPGYGVEFSFRGVHHTAIYEGDGSTTVAVAVDGLVLDAGSIDGLTITDSTTHMTIACDAAEDLDYIRPLVTQNDTAAVSVTVANTVAADIDTVDVSSIVEVIETLSGLNLVLCAVDIR